MEYVFDLVLVLHFVGLSLILGSFLAVILGAIALRLRQSQRLRNGE